MFLGSKRFFSQKSASLLTVSIIKLFLLFFSSITFAADKSEGETLVLQALKQIQDGLIYKSTFIMKDPPCMRARVVGESKAIGIYISSSALQVNDQQKNKRLLECTIDMVVRGLGQMLRLIERGEKRIFMGGSVDVASQPIYVLLTFSSSAFYPENSNFMYQAADLISRGLLDKDTLITEDGTPLIMWASLTENMEILHDLIQIGANINQARESDGMNALIIGSFNGYDGVAETLLENGAEIDSRDLHDRTSLMLATKKGYVGVVKVLLKYGAATDLVDQDGWSALIFASFGGHSDIAKLLLEKGAAVDLEDKDGWTALMFSISNRHAETSKLLIEQGALREHKSKGGLTANILEEINRLEEILLAGDGGTAKEKTSDNPDEQTVNDVMDIYILDYVVNRGFSHYWAEDYRLALKREGISSVLRSKLICFFYVFFSENKKTPTCLKPPE